MNLPQSDVRWSQMRMLLQEHRALREHISEQFTDFAKLDHQFHSIILSAGWITPLLMILLIFSLSRG